MGLGRGTPWPPGAGGHTHTSLTIRVTRLLGPGTRDGGVGPRAAVKLCLTDFSQNAQRWKLNSANVNVKNQA